MTKKKRLEVARHEAGHALMHFLIEVPFDFVWVGPENRGKPASTGLANGGRVSEAFTDIIGDDGDGPGNHRAGLIWMAGLAGERVGRGCGSAWCRGWSVTSASGDINEIREILPALGDAWVNLWLREAHEILTRHADAHRRLTDALVERGRLTYDECLALVEMPVAVAAAATAGTA